MGLRRGMRAWGWGRVIRGETLRMAAVALGVQGGSAPTCRNKSGLDPSRLRVVTGWWEG